LLPVVIPSIWFPSDSCGIRSISVDASVRHLLGRAQKMRHPAPRELCQPQLSRKNFLNRRQARQECRASTRALAKGYCEDTPQGAAQG
jgi:hypothetical protein